MDESLSFCLEFFLGFESFHLDFFFKISNLKSDLVHRTLCYQKFGQSCSYDRVISLSQIVDTLVCALTCGTW